jgi:hypothetical protein
MVEAGTQVGPEYTKPRSGAAQRELVPFAVALTSQLIELFRAARDVSYISRHGASLTRVSYVSWGAQDLHFHRLQSHANEMQWTISRRAVDFMNDHRSRSPNRPCRYRSGVVAVENSMT